MRLSSTIKLMRHSILLPIQRDFAMRLSTRIKTYSLIAALLCGNTVWGQEATTTAPAGAPEVTAAGAEQAAAPASDLSELDTEQRLRIQLSVYAWLSSITNDVTTSRSESTTDVAFSDLISALDFANFAHLEIQKGKWGMFSELDFVKLSHDAEFRNPMGIPFKIGADLVLKQTMIELGAFRSFEGKRVGLDALLGARYSRIDSDVNVGPLGASISKDWVDPMVGARLRFKIADRWNASLRGDFAGFGTGSELTTNAVAVISYTISDRYDVGFGYRYMDVKYETDRLDLDMTTYGPVVGMNIRF